MCQRTAVALPWMHHAVGSVAAPFSSIHSSMTTLSRLFPAPFAQPQGSVKAADRSKHWASRRVFYCTPQTFSNDLQSRRADGRRVVCVVIDEAHRATKAHAYVQCMRLLDAAGSRYRVLALSATPGSDLNKVQEVVTNLHISRIDVRTLDDPSVKPYKHETTVDKITVPLSRPLEELKEKFVALMQRTATILVSAKQLPQMAVTRLSSMQVLKAREDFVAARKGELPQQSVQAGGGRRSLTGGTRGGRGGSASASSASSAASLRELGSGGAANAQRLLAAAKFAAELEPERAQYVLGQFTLLLEFIPALRELTTHGTLAFQQALLRMEARAAQGKCSRARAELVALAAWKDIMQDLAYKQVTGEHVLHPKLVKLGEELEAHFRRKAAAGVSTRAIIFTQTRSSVDEILRYLDQRFGDVNQEAAGGGTSAAATTGSHVAGDAGLAHAIGFGVGAPSTRLVLRAAAFVGQSRHAALGVAGDGIDEGGVGAQGADDGGEAGTLHSRSAGAGSDDENDANDEDDGEEDLELQERIEAAAMALVEAADDDAEVLLLPATPHGQQQLRPTLKALLSASPASSSARPGAQSAGNDRSAGAAPASTAGMEPAEPPAATTLYTSGVAARGQTQKEQVAIIDKFRHGQIDVLVATCIAEEGLDIGEVGIIVMFDAVKSPIRTIQRLGRTGRKTAGECCCLVSEAEGRKFDASFAEYRRIAAALRSRQSVFRLYDTDPVMVTVSDGEAAAAMADGDSAVVALPDYPHQFNPKGGHPLVDADNDGSAGAAAAPSAGQGVTWPVVAAMPFDSGHDFVAAVTSGRYAAHPAGFLLPRMERLDMDAANTSFHASQVAGLAGHRTAVAAARRAGFGITASQQLALATAVSPAASRAPGKDTGEHAGRDSLAEGDVSFSALASSAGFLKLGGHVFPSLRVDGTFSPQTAPGEADLAFSRRHRSHATCWGHSRVASALVTCMQHADALLDDAAAASEASTAAALIGEGAAIVAAIAAASGIEGGKSKRDQNRPPAAAGHHGLITRFPEAFLDGKARSGRPASLLQVALASDPRRCSDPGARSISPPAPAATSSSISPSVPTSSSRMAPAYAAGCTAAAHAPAVQLGVDDCEWLRLTETEPAAATPQPVASVRVEEPLHNAAGEGRIEASFRGGGEAVGVENSRAALPVAADTPAAAVFRDDVAARPPPASALSAKRRIRRAILELRRAIGHDAMLLMSHRQVYEALLRDFGVDVNDEPPQLAEEPCQRPPGWLKRDAKAFLLRVIEAGDDARWAVGDVELTQSQVRGPALPPAAAPPATAHSAAMMTPSRAEKDADAVWSIATQEAPVDSPSKVQPRRRGGGIANFLAVHSTAIAATAGQAPFDGFGSPPADARGTRPHDPSTTASSGDVVAPVARRRRRVAIAPHPDAGDGGGNAVHAVSRRAQAATEPRPLAAADVVDLCSPESDRVASSCGAGGEYPNCAEAHHGDDDVKVVEEEEEAEEEEEEEAVFAPPGRASRQANRGSAASAARFQAPIQAEQQPGAATRRPRQRRKLPDRAERARARTMYFADGADCSDREDSDPSTNSDGCDDDGHTRTRTRRAKGAPSAVHFDEDAVDADSQLNEYDLHDSFINDATPEPETASETGGSQSIRMVGTKRRRRRPAGFDDGMRVAGYHRRSLMSDEKDPVKALGLISRGTAAASRLGILRALLEADKAGLEFGDDSEIGSELDDMSDDDGDGSEDDEEEEGEGSGDASSDGETGEARDSEDLPLSTLYQTKQRRRMRRRQATAAAAAPGIGTTSSLQRAGGATDSSALCDTPYKESIEDSSSAGVRPTATIHHGISCDGCGALPIRGQRWTCIQCNGAEGPGQSYDLCEKCRPNAHVIHTERDEYATHAFQLVPVGGAAPPRVSGVQPPAKAMPLHALSSHHHHSDAVNGGASRVASRTFASTELPNALQHPNQFGRGPARGHSGLHDSDRGGGFSSAGSAPLAALPVAAARAVPATSGGWTRGSSSSPPQQLGRGTGIKRSGGLLAAYGDSDDDNDDEPVAAGRGKYGTAPWSDRMGQASGSAAQPGPASIAIPPPAQRTQPTVGGILPPGAARGGEAWQPRTATAGASLTSSTFVTANVGAGTHSVSSLSSGPRGYRQAAAFQTQVPMPSQPPPSAAAFVQMQGNHQPLLQPQQQFKAHQPPPPQQQQQVPHEQGQELRRHQAQAHPSALQPPPRQHTTLQRVPSAPASAPVSAATGPAPASLQRNAAAFAARVKLFQETAGVSVAVATQLAKLIDGRSVSEFLQLPVGNVMAAIIAGGGPVGAAPAEAARVVAAVRARLAGTGPAAGRA